MNNKTFFLLLGVFSIQFLFCSCNKQEKFLAEHPTAACQINYFVSEANGDVAMIARMLDVDVSYLDEVRSEAIAPSSNLSEKLDELVNCYCEAVFNKWIKTKMQYHEARWYEWTLILLEDAFTLGISEL